RSSGAAELVMAKHFVREIIRDAADLKRATDRIAEKVWGVDRVDSSRFGVTAQALAIPALLPPLTVDLDTSEDTVAARLRVLAPAGHELVRHDDQSLMTDFYPLRVHLLKKRYVLIPIYSPWAAAMLSTSGPHTPLKLRVDNVYYCYRKISNLTK